MMGLNEAAKKDCSEYLDKNLIITECSQKKPYAFISYASDNWETVFKTAVVPMQQKYGLRLYADKAFDKVNDKWIVSMLSNIRSADIVIAFVSQSYIESYVCFLELLTAVNSRKQIVFVSLGEQLQFSDTTGWLSVGPGVKREILKQGADISTNTNNTSNDIMRAMKSSYTSLSTLLEQDMLSKFDISGAFINFFCDASINGKTINDLSAVKGAIESVSQEVFDRCVIYESVKVSVAAAQAEPAYQPAAQPASATNGSAVKQKTDLRRKKFRSIIATVAAVCCLALIAIVIGVNLPQNVVGMPYSMMAINGEHSDSAGIYTGKWKNDMPYGEGTLIYDNRDVYEGEWKDGQRNGQGIMTYFNGRVYIGEWKDDKKSGQGTYVSNYIYVGEWEDDEKNGQGAETYKFGGVYEGEFKDGAKNGQGTYTYANGDVYEGEFKDSNRNGQGTYTYANGDVYEGEWKNNRYNGQGTMTYGDGDVYEGGWEDDRYNGQGTYTYANGEVYEGEFKDGSRNGQGTYTFADGSTYEGGWKDGHYNGQGTYTFVDGSYYKGEWQDGKINGKGTCTFVDGSHYEGEFKDDKFNGQGTLTHADGTVVTGTWQDGIFIG